MTSPLAVPTHLDERRQTWLRHDMAQALSAMSAVLGLIETDPLHAATVLSRLEQLRTQVEWMAAILEDAMGDPLPCDVGEAVAEAWSAEGKHVLCSVRLRREHVAPARVDPVALRRALRNLLDNAIRAAGLHGRVDITVCQAGERIVVDVSDDGPGFGRIPTQSGLGLSEVRAFAQSAGGSVSVTESELGGTLIRLEIPALRVLTFRGTGGAA